MRLVALETPKLHRLWGRLGTALRRWKVAFSISQLGVWRKRGRADDMLLVDGAEAKGLPKENPAFVLLTGQFVPDSTFGRPRTLWIATSDWAAAVARAGDRPADRIIYGGTDVDTYFPSDRQRQRKSRRPVVLHDCDQAFAEQVQAALGTKFAVRPATPSLDADGLRQADIWLSNTVGDGIGLPMIDALATGLVVVGAESGILWPPWWDPANGAMPVPVGYTPQQYAAAMQAAWKHRGKIDGRRYARQWLNLDVLGQKWLEAVLLAAKRFKIKDAG